MQIPMVNEIKNYTSMIQEFGGYNHNLRINDNQFYEMMNLTSNYYPVLSVRKERGEIRTFTNPKGLFATDKLIWVENGKLYYETREVCSVTDTEKQMVAMGSYVCVFPDKIVYNTTNDTVEQMEQEFTSTGTVTYTMCKDDGTNYDATKISIGTTAPTNTTTYPYWIDTSVTPNVFKMWSSTSSSWSGVGTTYIKIENTGIGENYSQYDGVKIEGSTITDLNNTMILYKVEDDYVIVTGLLNQVTTQTDTLTLKREVPDMDYICESDNRLWGCSSENHEIYASKLGDPKNWNVFMGLASDSYAATVGTSGEFTGCIAHLGYVLFFKENVIHKVYGKVPSSFQISDVHCRGVQKGSSKSLVRVSETLFYKSRDGVCIFDGSMPENIGAFLGTDYFYEAVGAQLNDKYYISMRDSAYQYYLFVYDASRGLWHKEDDTKVLWFAYYYGGLYYIDSDYKMRLVNNEFEESILLPKTTLYPSSTLYPGSTCANSMEGTVPWMCETGDIGLEIMENKYVSKINIRIYLESGSSVSIYAQYDSDGVWELIDDIVTSENKTRIIPIKTKRCDHMKLKLKGEGAAMLYSLQRVVEKGSEINADN